MYIGLDADCPLFVSEFSDNFLDKISKNFQISNLNENPSTSSRDVPYGRTYRKYEANSQL
jgi:hypothetical protein